MNLTQVFSAGLRYRPWRTRHIALVARDLLRPSREPERDTAVHLQAAVDWLCRAQDRRNGCADAGSVSAGWSFEDGWLPGYPETSGYIVETLIAAAKVLANPALNDRAHRIIDWELAIQRADGAFPGHFGEPGSQPVIFNTGQILHGMIAGFSALNRDECLDSARAAAGWMMARQDSDGCWRKDVHNGVPHTYNTRAAWAIARLGALSEDNQLIDAARRNLDWALEQQTASGWFHHNGFLPGQSPYTHTIAYALRGLLEAGSLLGEERFIASANRAACALAAAQHRNGSLAGAYDDTWVASARYTCLTGVAQMALVWFRLASVYAQPNLRGNAQRAIAFLKRNHYLTATNDAVRGGIAGSVPIWGAYSRFEYPNWPVKFFADALMSETGVTVPEVATAQRRHDETTQSLAS